MRGSNLSDNVGYMVQFQFRDGVVAASDESNRKINNPNPISCGICSPVSFFFFILRLLDFLYYTRK